MPRHSSYVSSIYLTCMDSATKSLHSSRSNHIISRYALGAGWHVDAELCLACSVTPAQAEQLLLKIGSVLEYAEPFVQRMPSYGHSATAEPASPNATPSSPSADPATPASSVSSPPTASTSEHAIEEEQWDERLGSKEYTQAMVKCARALLAECCSRCWPALASKVVTLLALRLHLSHLVTCLSLIALLAQPGIAAYGCQVPLIMANSYLQLSMDTVHAPEHHRV